MSRWRRLRLCWLRRSSLFSCCSNTERSSSLSQRPICWASLSSRSSFSECAEDCIWQFYRSIQRGLRSHARSRDSLIASLEESTKERLFRKAAVILQKRVAQAIATTNQANKIQAEPCTTFLWIPPWWWLKWIREWTGSSWLEQLDFLWQQSRSMNSYWLGGWPQTPEAHNGTFRSFLSSP